MKWYLRVLKAYAAFEGRSRRQEYWMFFLVNLGATFLIRLVEVLAGMGDPGAPYGPLSGVYAVAVMIPSVAVSVRRLHDTGRNGLWLLISLVPLVGAVLLLVFLAQNGDSGENRYGADPKASALR